MRAFNHVHQHNPARRRFRACALCGRSTTRRRWSHARQSRVGTRRQAAITPRVIDVGSRRSTRRLGSRVQKKMSAERKLSCTSWHVAAHSVASCSRVRVRVRARGTVAAAKNVCTIVDRRANASKNKQKRSQSAQHDRGLPQPTTTTAAALASATAAVAAATSSKATRRKLEYSRRRRFSRAKNIGISTADERAQTPARLYARSLTHSRAQCTRTRSRFVAPPRSNKSALLRSARRGCR